MAILTGARLRKLLFEPTSEVERLIVSPLLDIDSQVPLSGASVNVRLGPLFTSAKRSNTAFTDPVSDAETAELWDTSYIAFGQPFILHPRQFVLGSTLEYIRIPRRYGSYVIGRSTLGRRGLVIATAVGIHPGFAGNLALELTNLGEVPLRLFPGTCIAQLFLHTSEGESEPDASQYVASTTPIAGTLSKDPVLERLLNPAQG